MARPNVTLSQAVEEYLTVRADLSVNTRRQYISTLGLFCRTVGRELNIRNLTAKHCEYFFVGGQLSRRKMLAPATFNKERLIVRGFVQFCVTRQWVNPNVMENVRTMKVQPRKKLWLSPTELMFILDDQEHPRDRMIVALGLNTALRASEIASLRLADVDLAQGWLYTTLHKNNKVDCFPINSDLDGEIRRWLLWYQSKVGPLQDDYFLVPARKPNDIVLSEDGRSIIQSNPDSMVVPYRSCLHHIRTPIHRSLTTLGYEVHGEGLHTLRRSVARCYYDKIRQEGEDDPLRVTQQLLNHSSALTTEKYLGVEPERRRRDDSLRGKPFLSSLISGENVVKLDHSPREDHGNGSGQDDQVRHVSG